MTALTDRYWSKVEKTEGCWLWTAARSTGGYGRYYSGGRRGEGRLLQAHRVAYEALVGAIPEGLHLDHICRNRACVNPAHLEPVAPGENVLRGEGVTARSARRDHCEAGHPYTEENTYWWNGWRYCRKCRVQRQTDGWRRRQQELRAQGLVGIRNAEKTHCPAGHPYTEENTRISKTGKRSCKECGRRHAREYQRRKRQRE